MTEQLNHMKQTLPQLIVFVLLLCSAISYSQSPDDPLNKSIRLEPGSYRLEMLVEMVNSANSVVITYNGENIPPGGMVKVTKRNPTIQQLLDDIERSLSVTYTIRNNYIILNKQQNDGHKISGIVTDKNTGEPLPGANVIVSNTLQGVITNEDGIFEIDTEDEYHQLTISYIGYEAATVDLNRVGSEFLEISLEPTSNLISEVRVTSKLRKFYNLDVGRPLESINATTIENTNLNNVSDILNGRFAGVWATQTSGMPGDHQRVHIRGISSIFGSVDPLYVIDGVSVPSVNLNSLGIADLNIHDIENITILKDASSTALFGFQGGNGVVLIDTKHGKRNNEFTFYTKQGVQWFPKRYDLMDTKDFLASMDSGKNKLGVNIRQYYPVFDEELQRTVYRDTLANTNWQDKIFQTGMVSEYQLSGSGSLYDTRIYLSGNYMNNKGIIKNSSYTRYTLAANIERTFFNTVTLNLGYRGSIQENRNNLDGYGGNQILFEGINKSPCQLSTPDSLYLLDNEGFDVLAYRIYQEYNALSSYYNIDSIIHYTRKSLDITSNMFRAELKYDITDYLYIKASYDVSLRKFRYLTDIQIPTGEIHAIFQRNNNLSRRITYINSDENVTVVNYMLNLKWKKKINHHEFSLFSGVKIYRDLVYWNDSVANRYGATDDELNTSDDAYIRNSMSIHGPSGDVIRNLNSILGNLNYNYKNKYFVSLAGNYENLIEGVNLNKKEFFPSVALSWDMAREFFFNKLQALNHLNLYSSWGRAGNYPLNGLSKDIYSSETVVYWGSVSNTGTYVYQLANHDLKQEIVEEYNYGVNIDLFRNSRIKASFDVYHKLNRNLIMLRDIPGYYGGGRMFYNVGEIATRGKEVTIELVPVLKKNIVWYSKFNFTTYSQSVKKLSMDSAIKVMNTEDILLPSFIINENQGLGDIYGYRYLGKWTPADEENSGIQYVNNGGLKYLNADTSNTTLDEDDMVVIGNSMPKLTWNWYNSFSYKNITIDMLWYAVIGMDKYNSTRAATYVAGT
ncbi:MAG: SusC/RagA family TonB-linked outer membrane protein, partial [Bacteroidales bacterium]